MKLKTNLHFHSGDDPMDHISYTTREGIDRAASLGFGALAITCHQKVAWTEEYFEYAKSKGLLLISGIEVYIGETRHDSKKHVLILNATKCAEKVRTWSELELYRKEHKDAFIVAPHPYFYGGFSLHSSLEKHIGLFDAVEQSWFYSEWFNRNEKGKAIAKKYKLPFISTSDTHYFDFLDTNFCTIDAKEATQAALFEAIRAGKFENTTSKRDFWREMIIRQGKFSLQTYRWRKQCRNKPESRKAG